MLGPLYNPHIKMEGSSVLLGGGWWLCEVSTARGAASRVGPFPAAGSEAAPRSVLCCAVLAVRRGWCALFDASVQLSGSCLCWLTSRVGGVFHGYGGKHT